MRTEPALEDSVFEALAGERQTSAPELSSGAAMPTAHPVNAPRPSPGPIEAIATTEDLIPPQAKPEAPSLDELLQEVDEDESLGGKRDTKERKARSSGIFRRIFGKK